MPRRFLLAAGLALLAPPAWADVVRMYSYDPANAETKATAGPLTFEFRQGLFHTTMISVRATEAQATADLKSATERDLGPAGLTPLIGARATGRDLYEVKADQDGGALIAAFCPGATRAWMAFGKPRPYGDLRVYVFGPAADGGPVRLCRTFDFSFHGAWRMPAGRGVTPDLTPQSPLPRY